MKRLTAPLMILLLVLPLTACERDLVEDCYKTLISAEAIYLAAGEMAGDIYRDETIPAERRKAFRAEIEPVLERAYSAVFFGYNSLKEYVAGTTGRAELVASVAEAAAASKEVVALAVAEDHEWRPPELHLFRAIEGRIGQ